MDTILFFYILSLFYVLAVGSFWPINMYIFLIAEKRKQETQLGLHPLFNPQPRLVAELLIDQWPYL